MAATINTLTAILKEFYLGPIGEQLNQETLVYSLFSKSAIEWSGRRVVIPVHTARNTGVGAIAEGGTLPTAGDQDYERLEVDAKFVYGRFRVSGPAISSSKSGNSFLSYVDAEMNKLVEDVKTFANQRAIFGGEVIGYVWQKHNNATFEYSGRTVGLQVGNAADTAQLVRMDTYATVGAATQVNAVAEKSITFNAAINTAAVPGGVVLAVVCDAAASSLVGGTAGDWEDEPNGITSNLSSESHFGVDRTSAAGDAALQSNHLTIANGTTAGVLDAYTALNLDRMQAALDAILEDSDSEPDCIIMHPAMRVEYTSLLVGTAAANLFVDADKASKGDGGFSGLAYGGVPMKTSKDMFKGTLMFLTSKTWKMCELEKPGFADLDGAILSRVANQDNWEGFYRLYYNVACTKPNANCVLTGVDF